MSMRPPENFISLWGKRERPPCQRDRALRQRSTLRRRNALRRKRLHAAGALRKAREQRAGRSAPSQHAACMTHTSPTLPPRAMQPPRTSPNGTTREMAALPRRQRKSPNFYLRPVVLPGRKNEGDTAPLSPDETANEAALRLRSCKARESPHPFPEPAKNHECASFFPGKGDSSLFRTPSAGETRSPAP